MISTLEIIDKLYLVLNVPALKNAITGGVYKQRRPLNSKKIDVVINSLPTNNLQLQTGLANVNIHVPNLVIGSGTAQDNTQPDFAKLRTISSIVIDLLKDQYTPDFWYDVENQTVFPEDNINEHYSNIRVKIFNINI